MQDETPRPSTDPWRHSPELPRALDAPHFHDQIRNLLAGHVEFLDPGSSAPRHGRAGGCRMDANELPVARDRFAKLPMVGVVATPEAGPIIEASRAEPTASSP